MADSEKHEDGAPTVVQRVWSRMRAPFAKRSRARLVLGLATVLAIFIFAFLLFELLAWQPAIAVLRQFYLKLLAVCYLAAFASLAPQLRGLVGEQGAMPVSQFLTTERWQRYGWRVATLLWLSPTDGGLLAVSAIGIASSCALLLTGAAPFALLCCSWACYLSLAVVCRVFTALQWDALLLEAGALALLWTPLSLCGGRAALSGGVSAVVRIAHLTLATRLLLSSGIVKHSSGCPAWASLTAMRYHYWTQPLPHKLSWPAARLSPTLQQLSAASALLIQLCLSPLLLLPARTPRLLAAAANVSLQLLIAATGNYGFFNALTAALLLTAADDALLPDLVTAAVDALSFCPLRSVAAAAPALPAPLAACGDVLRLLAALLYMWMSYEPLSETARCAGMPCLPAWLSALRARLRGFRILNGYGLFARMTTTRDEIVLQGSSDLTDWQSYDHFWKPTRPDSEPRAAGLHMPRFDWRCWFLPLGSIDRNAWFQDVMLALLQGRRDVPSLFAHAPFTPQRPPTYLRVVRYQFRFAERGSAHWWRVCAASKPLYCPPVTLSEDGSSLKLVSRALLKAKLPDSMRVLLPPVEGGSADKME